MRRANHSNYNHSATVNPIIVQSLRIESTTGPTCYRGESGFSALIAYVKCDDAAIVDQLRRAAVEGTRVIVECGALQVEGRVGKLQFTTPNIRDPISISVDDLRFSKPNAPL